MARTDPQVNFRIPAELKDKLDNAAKENGRTLTAELILRLEETFKNNNISNENNDLHNKVEILENTVDAIKYQLEQLQKQIVLPDGK